MAAPPNDAFLALINAHVRLLHKVCGMYAQDAEDRKDLFQEIVLQAWRAFPKFRSEASGSTWLYRVALNTAISRQRRERSRPQISHGEEALLSLADSTPEDSEAFQSLHRVITRLPELERALLLLHLDDRGHAEIAAIMGISVSNVGTRLTRIREKLRRLMSAEV